jgi:predicted O-linked N-acetylglucosamine transferase (SPINDLY family)
VVFGSFSNLAKLTSATITAWSQILHALPGSRLLLTTKYLDDPKTSDLLIARFMRHDVNPSQILLQSTSDPDEWLATYARVDIVLDPFPRTGCTTTAEALWMGLPVITLAGGRYVERASAMVLTAVGLPDLVTSSQEEYVNKALSLAFDQQRREELRADLRELMSQSPLCDGKGLARAMEAAFQNMWEKSMVATH